MTNISTAALPQNIQSAIAKFSQAKATYLELQERLAQLAKKLEKHQKSAEANKAQAEQLGLQWREAFRENNGEITKEIRTTKNSEQEAHDFAEEYTTLAEALTPEFNHCQLETFEARKKHQKAHENLQELYADYRLEVAANELFSLPQAKPFFGCLAYKLKGISNYAENTEPYSRIIHDDDFNRAKRLMNENLIATIFEKYLAAVENNYFTSLEIANYTLVTAIDSELTDLSPARLSALRAKSNSSLMAN